MKKLITLVLALTFAVSAFAFAPVNNTATMLPKGHMYASAGIYERLDNYYLDYSLGFSSKLNLHSKIYGTGIQATMEYYLDKYGEFHVSVSGGAFFEKASASYLNYGFMALANITYRVGPKVDAYFGPKLNLFNYDYTGNYTSYSAGIKFYPQLFMGLQVDLPGKWAMFMEIQPWFNTSTYNYTRTYAFAGVHYFFGHDVTVKLK